jgi:hypothetical protein
MYITGSLFCYTAMFQPPFVVDVVSQVRLPGVVCEHAPLYYTVSCDSGNIGQVLIQHSACGSATQSLSTSWYSKLSAVT